MNKTSTLPQPKKNKSTLQKNDEKSASEQFCPSDSLIVALLNYSKALKIIKSNKLGLVNNLLN
jgi:hypothetical protein